MESEVPEKRPGSDSGQVLQLLEEGAPLPLYGTDPVAESRKENCRCEPGGTLFGSWDHVRQRPVGHRACREALSESPASLILHTRTVYNWQAGSATLSLLIALNRSERVFIQ